MAYTTDTNTEITEFFSRAQTWLGEKSIEVSKKVANKKPVSTYLEDIKLGFLVDAFIRALDNQQNDWTEKEIVQYIHFWDAKLGLRKYPYIQRTAYNLNIQMS